MRKGPLYFVRNIDVSGNTLTVDDVVRREIPIVEGQLYSQRAVMLARGRIERLGFFEEVDLRMEPTDEPEQLDMNVTVVERPTGSFSFGAGYSSQDGIVVTGSLSQANLFGRGYNTQFSADVGGQTQRFYLSLQDPYVLRLGVQPRRHAVPHGSSATKTSIRRRRAPRWCSATRSARTTAPAACCVTASRSARSTRTRTCSPRA